MSTEPGIDTQLKDAAQLSEAVWAVLAERVGGAWILRSVYRLNKPAQKELIGLMARPFIDTWLCGALSGGYTRSSAIPEEANLKAERFFAFPINGTSQAILVGANEQGVNAQRIWKLTAVQFLQTNRSCLTCNPVWPSICLLLLKKC
jgi:hypothetical protein